MDFKLNIEGQGTLDLSAAETTLINIIHVSLAVAKGSWWVNPAFGSELGTLRRAKATAATARLVESYIRAALKWLTDGGKLTAVSVTTEIGKGRINYTVDATAKGGSPLKYSNFVEVA